MTRYGYKLLLALMWLALPASASQTLYPAWRQELRKAWIWSFDSRTTTSEREPISART